MWIIPQSLMLNCAPDILEYILDLDEQSEICAQSLTVRSKPSQSRTWSQKWKRDSWTQHLSGRILNPSHGKVFEERWTSSLADIRANHSVPQESEKATRTPGTSGHLSQMELLPCGLESSSLRTSKVTSHSDSVKSLPTWLVSDTKWKRQVANQRGEYSQRVKSAHLTRESGCSSSQWPTISVNESKNCTGLSQWERNSIPLGTAVTDGGKCLLRRTVSEEMMTNPEANAHSAEKITVNVDALDQLKTDTNTGNSQEHSTQGHRKHLIGQAAPANPSTHGSRQELWQTATVSCGGHRQADGSITPKLDQQVKQWATPQASDPEHSGPNQRDSSGRPALPAQAMQWATPRSGKTTDENPETWQKRADAGDVATMPLGAQVKQWGTPTARDHKSGRGNEEREYKELTPMVERNQAGKLNPRWVETLMGLPVGWTMPSCKFPQTIELTNSASLATEWSLPPQRERSEP